jgi:hypothetical protein
MVATRRGAHTTALHLCHHVGFIEVCGIYLVWVLQVTNSIIWRWFIFSNERTRLQNGLSRFVLSSHRSYYERSVKPVPLKVNGQSQVPHAGSSLCCPFLDTDETSWESSCQSMLLLQLALGTKTRVGR